MRNAAKAAGAQIVLDEAYPLGITDVTPLISKLRGSDAQIVFPISYLNDSLLIIRVMRQQRLTVPVVGGAAGYVIPDFAKALGQYSQAVLSIAPANYDQAPEYTERYRKRFGTFMPHEALEHAVCAGVLAQALEVAASDKPEAVSKALRAQKYDQGWAGVMSGGGVHFDASGLNTMAQPIMVQWQDKRTGLGLAPGPGQRAASSTRAERGARGARRAIMQFLQALVDGILLGGVYAVISIGLTLVFGVVSIVNFAQAEFLMVGMFVAYFAWKLLGLDPLLGSLLSFAVAFVLGVLTQKYLINRVLKAPAVAQIFLTVGLLIVMENLALILFGSEFRSVQTPYQMTALAIGPILLSAPTCWPSPWRRSPGWSCGGS